MTEEIPPTQDESRRSLLTIMVLFQVLTLWSFAAIAIVTKLV